MSGKKEKTKQAIMDASIRLISLHGYNATTTALIAKEIGLSETIIFKYFKNKENLLREVGNVAIAQFIENVSLIPLMKNIELSKDYPLRSFIKSILVERLSFLDKNFELLKVLIVEMQYSEELLLQVKDMLFPKIKEVFETIKNILTAKKPVSDIQVSAIARIVLGTIESFTIQKYLLRMDLTTEEMESEIEEILNMIEKSIDAEGGQK